MPPTVPPPPPLYGVVRAVTHAGVPCVVVDTTDAAVTRLVGLLTRRPSLLATLSDAADPDCRSRHRAVAELSADPDVREATTCRLGVEDATRFAVAIITAASPGLPHPAAIGVVGAAADRNTDPSANPRKDPR